jgi:hypothetical protein
MKTTMMMVVMMMVVLGTTMAMADVYVVRSGDTPSAIAKKMHVPVSAVMQQAGISDARKLRIGKRLEFGNSKVSEVSVKRTSATSYPQVFVPQNYRSSNAPVVVAMEVPSTKLVTDKSLYDETEYNLAVAREKRMTASNAQMPVQETAKSVEANEEASNKFVEASATIGGWQSSKSKTSGLYGVAEATGWMGNGSGDQNIGLGLFGEIDKGKGQNGVKWGSKILAIQPAFWKNFDDKNFLLLKPRIGYKWNDTPVSGKPEKGMTIGGYAEVARVLTPRDLGIIAGDGWYFQDDSYGAVRIWWERMVNKDWKVKAGVGPVGHWSKEDSSFGISPALVAKYNDTISVGVTVDTSKGGPFYGAFVTSDFNSDIHHPFSSKR